MTPEGAHAAPSVRLRAPRRDEVGPLLRFIAALNQPGEQHCLHLAESVPGIEADLEREGVDVCADFLLAVDAGGWRGAAGLQRDGGQGWLLGPWTRDPADAAARRALLHALCGRPDLSVLRSFSNADCSAINADLIAAGLRPTGGGHVMQAQRGAWHDDGERVHTVAEAVDADAPALAALHREAFPGTWLAPEDLLAHARAHGRMLVVRDAAQRLLGSLCLSFNTRLPEADVEFVAVQPAARRAGVARALLRAALREAFDGGRCACVNLVVNDTNPGARRLYEASGFRHLFTGVAMRRDADSGPGAAAAPAA